jgi:hypothetical protein
MTVLSRRSGTRNAHILPGILTFSWPRALPLNLTGILRWASSGRIRRPCLHVTESPPCCLGFLWYIFRKKLVLYTQKIGVALDSVRSNFRLNL